MGGLIQTGPYYPIQLDSGFFRAHSAPESFLMVTEFDCCRATPVQGHAVMVQPLGLTEEQAKKLAEVLSHMHVVVMGDMFRPYLTESEALNCADTINGFHGHDRATVIPVASLVCEMAD